jgi:hypothetical protein
MDLAISKPRDEPADRHVVFGGESAKLGDHRWPYSTGDYFGCYSVGCRWHLLVIFRWLYFTHFSNGGIRDVCVRSLKAG